MWASIDATLHQCWAAVFCHSVRVGTISQAPLYGYDVLANLSCSPDIEQNERQEYNKRETINLRIIASIWFRNIKFIVHHEMINQQFTRYMHYKPYYHWPYPTGRRQVIPIIDHVMDIYICTERDRQTSNEYEPSLHAANDGATSTNYTHGLE